MGNHAREIERRDACHNSYRMPVDATFDPLAHFQDFTCGHMRHCTGEFRDLDRLFNLRDCFRHDLAVLLMHKFRQLIHVSVEQGFVPVEYLRPFLNGN